MILLGGALVCAHHFNPTIKLSIDLAYLLRK